MVCPKRPGVFPLCICDSIAFADRNPPIFASGSSWASICFFKPRNNARCFRVVASVRFIVVRERAIKRVLPGSKFYWDIVGPMSRIWVIKPAVALCPLFVPGTGPIRDKVVSGGLFANPKNSRHDTCFPREVRGRSRDGRFSSEFFFFFCDLCDLSREGRIKCNEEQTRQAN